MTWQLTATVTATTAANHCRTLTPATAQVLITHQNLDICHT
jgi:hypothetical protein